MGLWLLLVVASAYYALSSGCARSRIAVSLTAIEAWVLRAKDVSSHA